MDKTAERHVKRRDALRRERQNWEPRWQEVAEFVSPKRADFTTKKAKGEERTHRGYDGTPAWANAQLAAALHGMLTSPSQPWFELRLRDEKLNRDGKVKRWLEEVTRRMMTVFASPEGNFQSQIHEVYLDIAAFGTGGLYVGPSETTGRVVFSARPLSELLIAENQHGVVDTVYREFKLSARQALAKYPEGLPSTIVKAAEKEPDKKFEFLHAVTPNPKGEGFDSEEVEMSERKTLKARAGRYEEMPYLTPRWTKTSSEVYGRGPGLDALPDMRMLEAMMRTTIMVAEKAAAPPLIFPDDGFQLPIRTSPNSLIFRKSGLGGQQAPVQPLQVGDPRIGLEMANQVRDQILRAYNVETFNTPDRPNMTATEIVMRNQERMRMIGPMIGRLQSELLDPLIRRVYSLMAKRGQLPPDVPEALAESEIEVEYVSTAVKALRAGETQSIQAVLQYAAGAASMDPDALDQVDVPQSVRLNAEALGAPASILRSEDAADQRSKARREQQAQAVQMQTAQAAVDQMKTGGEAAAALARAIPQ